ARADDGGRDADDSTNGCASLALREPVLQALALHEAVSAAHAHACRARGRYARSHSSTTPERSNGACWRHSAQQSAPKVGGERSARICLFEERLLVAVVVAARLVVHARKNAFNGRSSFIAHKGEGHAFPGLVQECADLFPEVLRVRVIVADDVFPEPSPDVLLFHGL